MPDSPRRVNAFSLDVEDWFHPELVHRHVPVAERTPRVRASLEPLLAMLKTRGVRATFFVVGSIMDSERELVRQIHREGHEIGCHGMTHRPLWELDPEVFREELREWRSVLASVDPQIPAQGYRAPTFSLDQRSAWALEILAQEGFAYDSSIFPFRSPLYGVRGAPLAPYRPDPEDLTRHLASGPVREFPMTVLPLAGLRVPVSGGFYLRALPYPFLAWALRRVSRQRPFVLYGHPWEFDLATPRRRLGARDSLITYLGMRTARRKLGRLLDEFPGARVDEVLAAWA